MSFSSKAFTSMFSLLAVFVSFCSCITTNRTPSQVAVLTVKFYDTATKDYITAPTYGPPQRVWYCDSFAIEEVMGINISQWGSHQETRSMSLNHFTFMDLRSHAYYRYYHFSDTAALVKAYKGPNPQEMDGPWNFYIAHGNFEEDGSQKPSDTSINAVLYRRVKGFLVYKDENGNMAKAPENGYLRCDLKFAPVHFSKAPGEITKCPLLRVDDITYPMLYSLHSNQAEIIANKFSSAEWKVFNAWKKYAKDHPLSSN